MEANFSDSEGNEYFFLDTLRIGRNGGNAVVGVAVPEEKKVYLVQMDPLQALAISTQIIQQAGEVIQLYRDAVETTAEVVPEEPTPIRPHLEIVRN